MRYYLGLVCGRTEDGRFTSESQHPQSLYLDVLNIVELNELEARKGS